MINWYEITVAFFTILYFKASFAQSETSETPEAVDFYFTNNGTKLFSDSKADWAHSPVQVTYLAKEEQEIYQIMLKYRDSIKDTIHLLESYTKDYADGTDLGDMKVENDWQRAEAIAAHPLMTYRMIRRFAYDLVDIKIALTSQPEKRIHLSYICIIFPHELIKNEPVAVLLEKIEQMKKLFSLPTHTDVENVMNSILRIQSVYELSARELMRGNIAGKETGVVLNVAQAYMIGKYASDQEMFPEAADWLQNVLLELKADPSENSIHFDDVFDSMVKMKEEHNKLLDTINRTNFVKKSVNRFVEKIGSGTDLQTLREYLGDDYFNFKFMNTCSGKNIQSLAVTSKLFCHLDSTRHPLWIINPLKIEVHSLSPYIYQIYDAMGPKIIRYLQENSISQLTRATVIETVPGIGPKHYQISSARTSSYTFLYESRHKILYDFEKKIGYMSGLKVHNLRYDGKYVNILASEAMQVAVYSSGNHFVPHVDALQNGQNETWSGDRIGTMMFYLNDVELGGATAFPEIRLSVPPVKGSALFWYDLLMNGDVDHRSIHGGCPVILGEKWIANKWIHHNANFRNRPCSLNPED